MSAPQKSVTYKYIIFILPLLTSEGEYRENIEIPREKGDMLETRIQLDPSCDSL